MNKNKMVMMVKYSKGVRDTKIVTNESVVRTITHYDNKKEEMPLPVEVELEEVVEEVQAELFPIRRKAVPVPVPERVSVPVRRRRKKRTLLQRIVRGIFK